MVAARLEPMAYLVATNVADHNMHKRREVEVSLKADVA